MGLHLHARAHLLSHVLHFWLAGLHDVQNNHKQMRFKAKKNLMLHTAFCSWGDFLYYALKCLSMLSIYKHIFWGGLLMLKILKRVIGIWTQNELTSWRVNHWVCCRLGFNSMRILPAKQAVLVFPRQQGFYLISMCCLYWLSHMAFCCAIVCLLPLPEPLTF